MPNPASHWTDERIELLKDLWKRGFSASQIASRLGGLSHCHDGGRSTVLGKLNRLQMLRRNVPRRTKVKTKKKAEVPPPPKPPAPKTKRTWANDLYEPYEPAVETMTATKTIMQLEEGDCRWPIGDPKASDFGFCGRAKHPGTPYCQCHAKIAFQPPSKPPGAPSHSSYHDSANGQSIFGKGRALEYVK